MKKNKILIVAIVLLLAGVLFIFIGVKDNDKTKESVSANEEIEEVVYEPLMAYGINVDSLILIKDKVKKNENLSDILLRHDVPYKRIHDLATNTREVFDVRKIRSGNKYTLIKDQDTTHNDLLYFVYEESATSYVVYSFEDSIRAYKGEKEVERRIAYAQGEIESSLWNALVEAESDPFVAVELSEVYAWVIDFFGIQKGDSFTIKYEQLYVDNEKIGVGRVLSSLFHHMGEDYYSFYYMQDSLGDYFDEEAQSLQRTFLKAPLKYRRISSKFSNSRLHPILKIRRPHHGVDYAAPKGTPVVSIGDGVVTKARKSGGAGKMVKVKHNGTYTTAYLHLSGYGKGVKEGAHVKQGQIIGYVGSTGLSTGPHLDFRVYKNGQAIDPLKMKSPPAKPVDSVHMDDYMRFIGAEKIVLDSLSNTILGSE
jgi:murein DD-endopeptidase MepM/ murein hydrolase activator NlpD